MYDVFIGTLYILQYRPLQVSQVLPHLSMYFSIILCVTSFYSNLIRKY